MNKMVLAAFLVAGALTGCIVEPGYVAPGYVEEPVYHNEEYAPGPDIFLFGVFGHEEHDREHGREHGDFDHQAGRRGADSRREAHPPERPGGHERAPSGGGHDRGGDHHEERPRGERDEGRR